ncbi:hypothetical protein SAMN06297251_10451 [Fulvimarina manganoxydans]|uniref:Uncharacterized protein n=1 Tax=Fulvimarina manganoxydans TaxID=937218 RepID=A0A1W2AA19_9HYPH|nr:hypothetical protein [Fulvimarina manganoxydans]SMC57423.1 hypothetical protein SAMN06297251_10451 [Fulvimarina manganoxydans]
MIVVIKKTFPHLVFATNSDAQLEDVREMYPAEEFDFRSCSGPAVAGETLPEGTTLIEIRPEPA